MDFVFTTYSYPLVILTITERVAMTVTMTLVITTAILVTMMTVKIREPMTVALAQCPGGSLDGCIALCPEEDADIYQAKTLLHPGIMSLCHPVIVWFCLSLIASSYQCMVGPS